LLRGATVAPYLLCGTTQVAVALAELPAASVALATIVYVRPVPFASREARSDTVRGPMPAPSTRVSGSLAFVGASLLVTDTLNAARGEVPPLACTMATCTILSFGGQTLQSAGMP